MPNKPKKKTGNGQTAWKPALLPGDIVRLAPEYFHARIDHGVTWSAVVLSVAEKGPDDPHQYLLLQGISTTGVPWRSVVPAFMLEKTPNQL